ncbi:MAG: formate dehydrogenase accessory sulfurtransferase FdhD, partial [Verrucomicrobiota bacterium]
FVSWRGRPLFEKQLATLKELQPETVYLSANLEQVFPKEREFEVVIDTAADQGPISGLLAAFSRSEAEDVLVLGVDLPLMTSEFLSGLLEQGRGTVARNEKFWEPLVGWYPRAEMLALLSESYEAGERKLQRILDRAEKEGLVKPYAVSESEKVLFTNLNTPEDLLKLDTVGADREVIVSRYRKESAPFSEPDFVASEEPLEIRVNGQSVSVMMRTPGHDEELATGFLFTEGLIESAAEISSIGHLEDVDRESDGNLLNVDLEEEKDLSSLTRHVFTSSSCGVCGKATIESVFQQFPPIEHRIDVEASVILGLPATLRSAQKTFERTGGLHASALFTCDGELLLLREDVGRHNALDKVIGYGLKHGVNFNEVVLLVSGRVSFELTQKALAAGISCLAGISAPTSLAVELANRSGQRLIGFLREEGFNDYSAESAS